MRARFSLAVLSILVLSAGALAVAPAPDPEALPPELEQLWLRGGPESPREAPPSMAPFNYLREFVQMTDFLAAWQLADPDSSDYGGMIEAEAGYLGDVIQTDNTLEAIWCWSRYREFSGRDTYDGNVAAAWIYCNNYPAWLEEGAVGQDYYRVHNCAWGLTAVMRYEAATGDASYTPYAETCAQYIVDHPLDITDGTVYQQRLDAFCKSWAAGNLYLYGEALGNTTYMEQAVVQGQDILGWLDGNPAVNLGLEYWAMSSGTAYWGVANSVFRDDPLQGQTWTAAYGAHLDTWQDWYNIPGYDWDGAWNVAYANAHFAAWDITGDSYHWDAGVYLTDGLLSYDTDDDGGIVAESMDPVTEDMSWVSCYLIKFGVDRLMGEPLAHDTGVLDFVSPAEGQEFYLDAPVPLRVLATNFGLSDETGVTLTLTGGPGGSQTVDLAFAALDTLDIDLAWIPPAPGFYSLTAATELAGDLDPSNDSATVSFTVLQTTAAPEGQAAGLLALSRNPFAGETEFRFSRGSGVTELEIFDVAGRRVRSFTGEAAAWTWDGRDGAGEKIPAGLYIYRCRSGESVQAGKLVKLR